MYENKEHSALGQAAGWITPSRAEARARFPGHHPDRLYAARLTVVADIAVNGARHYKLRCHACRRLSRTSLPQRLVDYPTMAQAPAMRITSALGLGLFLCPARHALWHEVMRTGAARL